MVNVPCCDHRWRQRPVGPKISAVGLRQKILLRSIVLEVSGSEGLFRLGQDLRTNGEWTVRRYCQCRIPALVASPPEGAAGWIVFKRISSRSQDRRACLVEPGRSHEPELCSQKRQVCLGFGRRRAEKLDRSMRT